jgi:hypothetical protein
LNFIVVLQSNNEVISAKLLGVTLGQSNTICGHICGPNDC